MAKSQLDPKDRKTAPIGLRAASKDRQWVHVDTVGEWSDVVATKKDTVVLTKAERTEGKTRLGKLVG